MAINVYTGVMGSGKSYEAMCRIVEALKANRRVVTNIDGVNRDKLAEHLGLPDSDPLSNLVLVTDEQVRERGFWAVEDRSVDTIVKHGDLVVLDEAWNFLGPDIKLSQDCRSWLRMHRHFVCEETKVASDLLCLVQDTGSLHRFVRGVVEFCFSFEKLKVLGLSKSYRCSVYQGAARRNSALISRQVKRYDTAIFPLYSSYSASGSSGAKELAVDGRISLWRSPKLLVPLFAGVAFLAYGGYGVFNAIGRMTGGTFQGSDKLAIDPKASSAAAPAGGRSASAPGVPGEPLVSVPDAPQAVVAAFRQGETYMALVNRGGVYRWEPAPFLLGAFPSVSVDGSAFELRPFSGESDD